MSYATVTSWTPWREEVNLQLLRVSRKNFQGQTRALFHGRIPLEWPSSVGRVPRYSSCLFGLEVWHRDRYLEYQFCRRIMLKFRCDTSIEYESRKVYMHKLSEGHKSTPVQHKCILFPPSLQLPTFNWGSAWQLAGPVHENGGDSP